MIRAIIFVLFVILLIGIHEDVDSFYHKIISKTDHVKLTYNNTVNSATNTFCTDNCVCEKGDSS